MTESFATELDLPIFPVAMDGLYKVWARNSWKIRPGKVKITIGKSFYAKDVLKNSPPYEGGVDAASATGWFSQAPLLE